MQEMNLITIKMTFWCKMRRWMEIGLQNVERVN